MSEFAEWLAKQSDSDPSVRELKALANGNLAAWPSGSNDLVAYQAAVAATAPANIRDQLLTALGRYYERWFQSERYGFWKRIGDAFVDYGDIFALAVGGVIIVVGLFYGIFISTGFLPLIGDPRYARGLIAFLFAFVTISIAVLVALALFWMDKEEIDLRFAKAKDLLAILVGILGTIIGFYFGTGGNVQETGGGAKVTVSAPSFEPKEAVAGKDKEVMVSAKVEGGTGPYQYQILVSDPDSVLGATKIGAVKDKTSNTGDIREPLTIPGDIAKAGSVKLKVSVKDAKKVEVESPEARLSLVPPKPAPQSNQPEGGK